MYIITLSQYGCVCLFHCFMSTIVNSYGHIWTVSYPNHTIPRQACLGQNLLVLRAHFFCQLKLKSALESVEAKMGLEIFSCVESNMLTFEPSSGTHT